MEEKKDIKSDGSLGDETEKGLVSYTFLWW